MICIKKISTVLNKVQSLVNILALLESEPDEVEPKLKAKIKELLENGQSWALKVGKCFNFLDHWTMSMTPEIQGSYNWYRLRSGGEIIPRKPWHQFVDLKEVQDVSQRVEQLEEAGLIAITTGVEVNIGDIDAILMLLEPEEKYEEDGQKVYFMQLWKKHKEESEEDEINGSFNTSRDDLDFRDQPI